MRHLNAGNAAVKKPLSNRANGRVSQKNISGKQFVTEH
jgi:hypothetical protein